MRYFAFFIIFATFIFSQNTNEIPPQDLAQGQVASINAAESSIQPKDSTQTTIAQNSQDSTQTKLESKDSTIEISQESTQDSTQATQIEQNSSDEKTNEKIDEKSDDKTSEKTDEKAKILVEIQKDDDKKDEKPKEIPIQDKVLNTEVKSPHAAVDQVYSSSYMEDLLQGFVTYIENTILKIDVRRISVDFSNTNIIASDEYRNLQVSQFSGDNSTVANFDADLALEYNFENSRFSNNLIMRYGFIILQPKDAPKTQTETADDVIFRSGYTRKAFLLEQGFIGPFMDGEYQSEFTRNKDANGVRLPRNQSLRYKAGLRMLDGTNIDELYFAGVGEIDFTYSPRSIRGALELGIRAKHNITDDIRMVYQGFYRQYIGFDMKRDTDLLYNLNLGVRVDVSVYKGFAFSPFISARFAKVRGAKRSGNNITTGVALLFSTSINAISSIQSTQNAQLQEYYKSIND